MTANVNSRHKDFHALDEALRYASSARKKSILGFVLGFIMAEIPLSRLAPHYHDTWIFWFGFCAMVWSSFVLFVVTILAAYLQRRRRDLDIRFSND